MVYGVCKPEVVVLLFVWQFTSNSLNPKKPETKFCGRKLVMVDDGVCEPEVVV
jgi:hypothetical protein